MYLNGVFATVLQTALSCLACLEDRESVDKQERLDLHILMVWKLCPNPKAVFLIKCYISTFLNLFWSVLSPKVAFQKMDFPLYFQKVI